VIQDIETPGTAFPFRGLLEFVEASCEHQLQGLVILDSEELETYKAKVVRCVQESYFRRYDNILRESSSHHLHHRIGQLQAELSQVYASLKEQQTELASLRSAQSKQLLRAYNKPNDIDTESDSDFKILPKRRRLSRRSNNLGMDGVEEQTMDDLGRHRSITSNWSHDVLYSSKSPYQQSASALYSSREHQSARSSLHRSRSHRDEFDTMSPRCSTLTEFGYDPQAAYSRSACDGPLMPPPTQPRTYAHGLATRKPKVDEYDPLGRLVPKDIYPLRKEKEDAAVTGTWTTIDPEDNRRNWDTVKKREWLQNDSYGSPSMSQTSKVDSHRDLWDRRNRSSAADSDEAKTSPGWATPRVEADRLVDPRFEDPELDVDPEVRVSNAILSPAFDPSADLVFLQSKFRDVTELLEPSIGPRSAFEQRNKDALSRNTAAAVKVIIGGQVAKTLHRKVDNRGELKDRHGKYIDGKDRGKMRKHLEEDRSRLIKERDEQLVRATQEKRAWDAMDPSEKERRLAKKARHSFLVGMLGAGMGGTDMYETEEIPVRQRWFYVNQVLLAN